MAGRDRSEVEDLIGFFVNMLVLRTDLSGNPSVSELVRRVEEVCVQALAHQQVPFEKLVQELQPERNLSHQQLFQVMFAMQSTSLVEHQLNGGKLTLVKQDSGTAKFDLIVSLVEGDDEVSGGIEYRQELFEEETAGLDGPQVPNKTHLYNLLNELNRRLLAIAETGCRSGLAANREWIEKSRRDMAAAGLTCFAALLDELSKASSSAARSLLKTRFLTHLHTQAAAQLHEFH